MLTFKQSPNYPQSLILQNEGKYVEVMHNAQQKLLKAKANMHIRDLLDAYVDLYDCYFTDLLIQPAIEMYEAHAALLTANSDALDYLQHYRMSYIYYDSEQQYDEGIEAMQKAISLAFASGQYHFTALCYCYTAALYSRKKAYEQAIQHVELGLTFMYSTTKPLLIHRFQCELIALQIYISSGRFGEAAQLIARFDQIDNLPKHHTLYMQYLFFRLRYYYELNDPFVESYRKHLFETIETGHDYTQALQLIPMIMQSIQSNKAEVHIWREFENYLRVVVIQQAPPVLATFQKKHQQLLHDVPQKLLDKTSFFAQANTLYEQESKPLTLLLVHVTVPEKAKQTTSTYVQFYIVQQAIDILLTTFPKQPLHYGQITYNKFAILFDTDETEPIVKPVRQLNSTINIPAYNEQYDVPFHTTFVSTLMSRTSTFLELYHIAEARLYYSLFQ